MDRRLVAVLTAVLLAGCGGMATSDGGTETLTPAPVPEPADATTETGTLPPGVTGNGVANVDRLTAAHQRATADQSYTLTTERSTSRETANETLDTRQVVRVVNESTYAYWTNERVVWDESRARYFDNYSEFQDPDGRYVRYTELDGETRQRQSGSTAPRPELDREATVAIERFLTIDNATVSVRRDDGERHYELRGEQRTFVTERPIRNVSVSAVIRHDGLVRSLSVQYWRGNSDWGEFVRYSFAYERLGTTTVEKPAWVRASED